MRLSMCLGRRLCTVLLALASITIAIAKQNASLAQDSPDLELQLAVVVNGHSIDKIGSFVERGKKLFVTRREWGDLGFKLPPPAEGETVTDDTELAVESLPGISVRLDEKTQTLYVTAATAAMEPTLLSTAGTEETGKVRVTSGWGSVVNYDVTGTHVTATNAAEGSLDGRVFTPYGVASSSLNATSSAGGTPGRVIRLDSTYSYSDPDTLQRTNVGDVVSGGLAWTRPVRLFAGQQTTDFSLRPDLVTTAVPTLAGQVAVPSSIDVLVNGVQLLSKDVQPGPFEIHQLPVVNGVDNVTMVVRDAAGNETIQNLPVYSSSLLLAPDLSNFSAEIGAVRLNYGDVSDDYHALAGIASYRYGLFDWVTIEGHAEAAASTRAFGGYHTPAGGMAGGGAAFKIGSLGAIAIDGAISDFGGRGGGLLYAAVEHTSSTFSISGAVQMASKGFGDVASAYGQPVPRMQIHAGVSVPLGNLGSISISYVGIQRPANTVAQEFPTQTPQTVAGLAVPLLTPANRVALLSATYSRPVFNRKAYFYATGFHDLANVSSFGLTFGLSIPLGRRTSGNVTANSAGKGLSYGSVQVSQSASTVGDFGYQVDESAGSPEQQMAEGDYKTPWNYLSVAGDRTNGTSALRATAQGSVGYAGGDLFAANTINDSFAIVDTTGTPDVTVLQENREVGRTDSSGRLLVPDLRSFDNNRLAIDPTDVPVDTEIARTAQIVRPQDRSGVVVEFPIHKIRGAVLVLVDEKGAPIPVGSSAVLAGDGRPPAAVVGYGGEVYATGLQPHDRVIVTRVGGQRCQAEFDYKQVDGSLPEIGPLTCVGMAPQ